jgi:hypothetical protein
VQTVPELSTKDREEIERADDWEKGEVTASTTDESEKRLELAAEYRGRSLSLGKVDGSKGRCLGSEVRTWVLNVSPKRQKLVNRTPELARSDSCGGRLHC